MSNNSNRPFAGPRVALPSHFPKSFRNSQPENPCRYLIMKLSDQSISPSDFFTQLLSIQNENREISFSILNCLLFYVLNFKPYHSQFCSQFTALFSKLIQNSSEPVRRSVLPLISILINNSTIMKSLSNEFNSWKDESKEIFLSFAFCFQPPEVSEWKPFLSNAKKSSKSENESLSCTANDFIEYMNYFLGKDNNKPKVRNSLDFTKEQFRRSMNFRTSMDFDQNQIGNEDSTENESENKENINENEYESDDNFVIEDSIFNDNSRSSISKKKTESSARSSKKSDIPSLRVSKQKEAMEELENDPFNQKSPFFDSLEYDQSESNINGTNRQSRKSIKLKSDESSEDPSSIIPTKVSKPQIIQSVELSKMKNDNNSRKSSKTSLSKESSHSQSKKETNRSSSKSSKSSKSSNKSFDFDVDDTNIEIEDIDIDVDLDIKSNSSGNLSDILESESTEMTDLLPKNISPQKSNSSVKNSQSKTKTSQSKLISPGEISKQRSSRDRSELYEEDIISSKEKKHQQKVQSSLSTNNKDNSELGKFQRRSVRTNQSSSDLQAIKSKKKQQSQLSDQNSYDQSSEANDGLSFISQPARPPSARRTRQANASSSESSPNSKRTAPPKKESQISFVDIDGVEETSNITNSNKRNSSILSKHSKTNVHNYDVEDDDDDEYSDDLFGAAPDYDNKVTFNSPPQPSTPDPDPTPTRPQSSKKKKPSKSESNSKSGNSKTLSPSSSRKRSDSRSSNSSTEPRGSPANDEETSLVVDYVSGLHSKDWEQQQRSVEGLRCIVDTKPGLLSSYVREVWMSLVDVIVSPRSMLSNSALQLAAELFTQFSSSLVPQTALFLDICFNLVCNSRQFISDAAENVIILIAQESPRQKVLNPFVKATGHKNSIARGKAAQCIAILVEQENPLDEREFKAVVGCLVPLVRDNRTETRYAAKETLKMLADDERFKETVKGVCTNTLDFNELMKSIET